MVGCHTRGGGVPLRMRDRPCMSDHMLYSSWHLLVLSPNYLPTTRNPGHAPFLKPGSWPVLLIEAY